MTLYMICNIYFFVFLGYSESNKKPNTISHPFNAKVIVITVVIGVILVAFVTYVVVRLRSAKYNINQVRAFGYNFCFTKLNHW